MKKIAIIGGGAAFSSKNMRLLRVLSTVAGLLVACVQHGMAAESQAIGLGKPVAASLRPDIFYWSFDDGIVGESEPSAVADLSGNGFEGHIINGRKDGSKLIYAEGKFGTGVYAQGFDSNVSWKETGRFNAASDPSKLVLKNQERELPVDSLENGRRSLVCQIEIIPVGQDFPQILCILTSQKGIGHDRGNLLGHEIHGIPLKSPVVFRRLLPRSLHELSEPPVAVRRG